MVVIMAQRMTKSEIMRNICPYCKSDLSKENWDSEFAVHLHYKKLTCKCGKKVWIRVNFNGSGHDSWTRHKKVTIESLVDKDDLRNR